MPEVILVTNNADIEVRLHNFSNFCYKHKDAQIKNRCGHLCPLSNYMNTFRIKPLYHNAFENTTAFSKLHEEAQQFWKTVCNDYGLDGINLDYGLQNVIYDIATHDIIELSAFLSENTELFEELKMYLSSSHVLY